MKRISLKKIFLFFMSISWIFAGIILSEGPERYFDTAELEHKEVRLTILSPSVGNIRALVGLKKIGFITLEELTVIGVYHGKERTNYQRSLNFVKKNNLVWFKFHKITEELNKDFIFQKNACTSEFETIFKKSDGIIFFGGADIPPRIYNEKTNLLTQIYTPYRHFLELSFIFHLLGGSQDKDFLALLESEPEFPILGICLGCQGLNVGTGGTLTQDIFSEKYGKKYLEDVIDLRQENWHYNPLARLYPEEKLFGFNMHPVKLKKDGKFCRDLGFNKEDTPYILSVHHQMAEKLGKGMKVIATSLDKKVVEAIEHKRFPHVLGVQFHPEFPILYDKETKFRFTPQDKEEKSLKSILEENPPSFEFHKKIWAWFSEKLLEYHNKK